MANSARSIRSITSTGVIDFDDGPGASMTRWSRHHPAVQKYSRSDHWTIMKTRAQSAGLPSLTAPSGPGIAPLAKKSAEPKQPKQQFTVKQCSECEYDQREGAKHAVMQTVLKPAGPPDLLDMPRSSARPNNRSRRSLLRTGLNERARSGYKYWYQERPKPTKFGRYGIGSYKTLLGLGNAPRT